MEEENFDMGLFDNDSPLELNLDFMPDVSELEDAPKVEEQEEETTSEADESQDETTQRDETQLSEEEVPETVAEEEEGTEGSSDDSPAIFSSFADVLAEQGLLPSADLQDKKVESIEDLTTLIKSEIDSQVKDYLVSKVGEEGYEALEKGVSLAEFQQYNETRNTLDNVTEDQLKDNTELAKEIILQDYIAQGLSESKAKRLLDKTVDLGEDMVYEDAVESLKSLKEMQQKQLEQLALEREKQKLEYEKQQQKIDNDLKNAVYNSEEYIKGLGKVDKGIQDKVYKSITTVVGKSPTGVAENKLMQDRRQNPVDFDVKLYYLYEVTNGFKDFSKIVKQSESKATAKLTDALRKTKFDTSGAPAFTQDADSYDGILGSELVLD